MNTKERITGTALTLLNKHGVRNVTVRHIAKEMGISHGNLCYHYPSVNDIVAELYLQYELELSNAINGIVAEELNLMLVYRQTMAAFNCYYKYRFIMIDYVEICRTIPELKKQCRKWMDQREEELLGIVQHLLRDNIFDKAYSLDQYRFFIKQCAIIAEFWLSSSEMVYNGKEKEKTQHYLNIFISMVVPYLTPKGLQQYERMTKELLAG